MLPSGNDAAQCISENIGKLIYEYEYKDITCIPVQKKKKESYSKYFIQHMNKLSQSINMNNSLYSNPHGLNNQNNYSTSNDISILISHASKRHEDFQKIINTQEYVCDIERDGETREIEWNNTHKLFSDSRFIGGKTGITIPAGPCLSSCMRLGGGREIVVVLLYCMMYITVGSSTHIRMIETKKITDWIQDNLNVLDNIYITYT